MLEGSSLRLIITGGLLLHGLGHGGAIGALAWIKAHPDRDAGGWRVARSWALPALRAQVATWLAWPVRNTLAAMAVNLLVLATLFGQP